jgi:hypothetical protein
MSSKERRRHSPATNKAIYKRRSEKGNPEHSEHPKHTRSKTSKRDPWQNRRRQLQQMDIEDLRQYIAETEDL